MKNSKVQFITNAAIIAALYVVLTVFAASFDLASGAVQVRFSEVLTVLPFFTPAGIYGVTLGCLIANTLTNANIFDIIFGTLASFIGCMGTAYIGRLFRKTGTAGLKFLAPLPPIIANALIVPFILTYAYNIPGGIPYFILTVGAGEIIACGIMGLILINILHPISHILFDTDAPYTRNGRNREVGGIHQNFDNFDI